jgi:hypothetical protein
VIEVLEDFELDGIAPHEAQCTGTGKRFGSRSSLLGLRLLVFGNFPAIEVMNTRLTA